MIEKQKTERPALDNDVVEHLPKLSDSLGLERGAAEKVLEKLEYVDENWTYRSQQIEWRLQNMTKKEFALAVNYLEFKDEMQDPLAVLKRLAEKRRNH